MGIQRAVTRLLVRWLPASDQARLATDAISWLASDLPPAQRQRATLDLAPRLLERIREGQFGLGVVAYYHLLRLPLVHRLHPPFVADRAEAMGTRTVVGNKA